jgi:hypothetical protein
MASQFPASQLATQDISYTNTQLTGLTYAAGQDAWISGGAGATQTQATDLTAAGAFIEADGASEFMDEAEAAPLPEHACAWVCMHARLHGCVDRHIRSTPLRLHKLTGAGTAVCTTLRAW